MKSLPLIDLTTKAALIQAVEVAVAERCATVFVPLYAACWRSARNDPNYAAILESSTNYADGTGVVRALRREGHSAERSATTDVVHPLLCLASLRRWRVVLYGAAPDVVADVAAGVRVQHPGIELVAVFDGYTEVDPADVLDLRPDLVLVARGVPTQEIWARQLADRAAGTDRVGAVLPCGGLFDFLAERRRRAPQVLQRAGLEWAFRVALEPRRLFGRYALGNAYFLYLTKVRNVPIARTGVR